MRIRLDGREREGRAVDLSGVDPTDVARAIRGQESPVTVEAPDPGPVHERVGPVVPSASVPLQAALAAAARTRGLSAPQDEKIEQRRRELADVDPPAVDREPARRRVAQAGDREAELHERVAELRGRVRTLEERGDDASQARKRLQQAVADLTEARTERLAARQRLEALERRSETARDRRERRLRIRDRIDNLRRSAREHLAEQVRPEFRAALASVPGPESVEDDCTVALAVVRVADLSAPVVVACGRFPDAGAARSRLDAPVIRVDDSAGV